MEKIYFKSEERTAKKGVLAPFPANYVFKKTGLKTVFSSMDSPNLQL